MRHPFGDHKRPRGPGDRRRIRAEVERAIAWQRIRQAHDTDADAGARRLTEALEDAVLTLDTQPIGFEQAVRKADHVEELRRVLGILLDVLADWELLADREH